MKLSEMWVGKPTDVWLHRLNKDGAESGMRDARRYYKTKQDAISHHNYMVDANPGKEIAHNLHMSTELGHFKLKLIGRQTGKAQQTKREKTMDDLISMLDQKGSAASAWMQDDKWEELLKLYNAGADIKVVNAVIPKGNVDPDKWFKSKIAMMEPKGYKLFAQEENFGSVDMIFVRK